MGTTSSALMSEDQKSVLITRWTRDLVEKEGKNALELFSAINISRSGKIVNSELSIAFGLLDIDNSGLSRFFFGAIDLNSDGIVDLYEFVSWYMTVLHGTDEEKLCYGYRLLDIDKDNTISKVEIIHCSQAISRLVNALELLKSSDEDKKAEHNFLDFADKLSDLLDVNEDNSKDCEVYKQHFDDLNGTCKTLGAQKEIDKETFVSSKVGSPIFFGDENWNYALCVMMALERSIVRFKDTKVEEGDTKFKQEAYTFPTHSVLENEKQFMTTYYPHVFKALRASFKVKEDQFIRSIGLTQFIGSLLLGQFNVMSGLVSEGKSGSFFYFTHDGKYMIKTISSSEHHHLKFNIHQYFSYLKDNPNSLLTRFYGLYKLKLKNTRTYFIVMANIFDTPLSIDQKFDTKGSTVGRSALNENMTDYNNPKVIYKDIDWIQMNKKLRLGPKLTTLVWEQIQKDAEFLREREVIDYSLLVGIHNNEKDKATTWTEKHEKRLRKMYELYQKSDVDGCDEEKEVETLLTDEDRFNCFCKFCYNHSKEKQELDICHTYPSGGFGPLNSNQFDDRDSLLIGQETIFIGIIDHLVTYEAFKQAEHLMKSMVHDKRKISVVAPDIYHRRFLRFVQKECMEGIKDKLFAPHIDDEGRELSISSSSSPKITGTFRTLRNLKSYM